MASPRMKREQSFELEASGVQELMAGSASASYSPPGAGFGSPVESSSPRDGRKKSSKKDRSSWIKHTLTPHFDGHLWRKYGQKNIKDAEFPRLYYRCSYREDRNCQAAKLVQQQSNADPPFYKVTYTYEHTCNAAPFPTPDVMAAEPPAAGESSSFLLRFDSTGSSSAGHEQEQPHGHSPSRGGFMLCFDSNREQEQPAAVCSEPAAMSSGGDGGRGMPGTMPPVPDAADDTFSTWDPFRFGLDDHFQFGHDHIRFPPDDHSHNC